jgi:hypothetical protein
MLKESREDLNKQSRQHDEELAILHEQLQHKRDLDFVRFKEFAERGSNSARFHDAPSSIEVSTIENERSSRSTDSFRSCV